MQCPSLGAKSPTGSTGCVNCCRAYLANQKIGRFLEGQLTKHSLKEDGVTKQTELGEESGSERR